jgi:K+-sensing histidine kinase KdpD
MQRGISSLHTGAGPPMIRRGELQAPYRMRTVRYLITASWLVMGVVLVYLLLPGGTHLRTPLRLLVLAIGAASTAALSFLPWPHLFQSGAGMRLLVGWVAGDIVLLSIGVALSGGADSPYFLLYGLCPIFLASAFSIRLQAAMLGFTYLCYVGAVAWTGFDVSLRDLFIQFGVLAIMTVMAGSVTQELIDRVAAQQEAYRESDRRASLLAKLASAARNMAQLGPDEVLDAVIDAVLDLGFTSTDLSVLDHDAPTYRVVRSRGLPTSHLGSVHPATTGLVGLVTKRLDSVVVHDYAGVSGALEGLSFAGRRPVVGVPIWCDGELTAVLGAAFYPEGSLTPQDVETLELLADQAGHALENARKFEIERTSVERLQELDRMKSDFIATVSHEIRTPLTAIGGIGSTLEKRWSDLSEELRIELMARLNSNARVLDEIICNLLDFSRIESGVMDVHREPVEVKELVDSVLHRLDALLTDHTVTAEVPHDLLLEADPMLLDRVLENLVANACRHTPKDTKVTVSARRSPDGVEIRVADNGPGIPEHELAHLGERFFRGGDLNSRKTRGTGLGLALVTEVLKLHGTTLDVESEVGRGSAFSFQLAAAPARAPTPAD